MDLTNPIGIVTDIIGDLSGTSAAEAKAQTAQAKLEMAQIKSESFSKAAWIVGGIIAAGLVGAAFVFRK